MTVTKLNLSVYFRFFFFLVFLSPSHSVAVALCSVLIIISHSISSDIMFSSLLRCDTLFSLCQHFHHSNAVKLIFVSIRTRMGLVIKWEYSIVVERTPGQRGWGNEVLLRNHSNHFFYWNRKWVVRELGQTFWYFDTFSIAIVSSRKIDFPWNSWRLDIICISHCRWLNK